MAAIFGFTPDRVIAAVKEMYSAVASAPERPYHFPVGRDACLAVGYSESDLAGAPQEALAAFAGVGDPFRAGAIGPGDTVLDLGAGAGTDSCIAARLVGPGGRVFALDMTPAMLERLRALKARHALSNLEIVEGSAESIPLPDASVDVVTSNGVLNLVPNKRKAVAEIFRVLRPGGRVQIADIVIARPVDAECRVDPKLWAECVVGATVDEDYLDLFRDAGFEDVTVLGGHDYFTLSRSAETREIARRFGARAVEISMRRGAVAPSAWVQRARRLDPRRWIADLHRRGLAGTAALATSVACCYGSLAAIALLSFAGFTLALNDAAVAGAIMLFAALAALAVRAGTKHHGRRGPLVLAVAGVAVLAYAMLLHYHFGTELAGFALLAGAVLWDFRLRRHAGATAFSDRLPD
jgi:arsenite methyltransferase